MGYKRLSCFQTATGSDKAKASDASSDFELSLVHTEESLC